MFLQLLTCQCRDFLHDAAAVTLAQEKSDVNETRFHAGFMRRQQQHIQQDAERSMYSKQRTERKTLADNQRMEHLTLQTYKSGMKDPIAGHVHQQTSSKVKNIEKLLLSENHQQLRKNFPEKRLDYSQQTNNTCKQNVQRQLRIQNEGLTETKKNYSVKEFFTSYDSFPHV